MSLKTLPKIKAKIPNGVKWDAPSDALNKWNTDIVSANTDAGTITIYDQIGSDGWSDGVTSKGISAALRSIGERDVVVSINSPGGDFFEGIAIYNILREHKHKVTVKVVGLAASAASIIAMAGDEIQVAKTGFVMVHNAWVFAIGNRHDLREAATVLDEFDSTMAGLYSDATGISKKEAEKLMDDETWMSGERALELGFATSLLNDSEIIEADGVSGQGNAAIKKVDVLLAKQGLPRSERRELIKQIKGTPGAANVTQNADTIENLNKLIETITR